MNEIKEKWIENLNNIFKKSNKPYELLFTAKPGDGGNRFYYDNLNKNIFLMADVIYKVDNIIYSFQMVSDKTKEYRFSKDLKYFWEIDLKTSKRTKWETNWPQIWKKSKEVLDSKTNKYNIFILLAHNVNYAGSGQGIYAVSIGHIEDFLENKNR